MDLLDGLNERQEQAVLATEGPVMVMAGAGSGKTKVLTTRISYIISELGINPYSILAVTFTNKAASEMKERISKVLDIDTSYMWVSTFHSFCSRLLRLEIANLGGSYNKYFQILDDEDSNKIIRDILKQGGFDEKPKDIKNLISKVKNGINISSAVRDPNLNRVYDFVALEYELYLKNNNLLDFDDLILKTIELFNKCPNILKKYQDKFEYILIDEFQDTNTYQYDLMTMLAAGKNNIFVVGDDFQSIYSFRGARIENINRFRDDYKNSKLILLEKNYRSTTQILNLANNVIDKNENQIKKVMTSNNKTGNKPRVYCAESSKQETRYVIDKINKLILKGYKYSDIAIIYRANYISRNFEEQMMKNQIPYQMYGGTSFFERMEVKDLVAYLRLFVYPNDNFSFERIVNVPKRKIGPSALKKLHEIAIDNKISLFEAIDLFDSKGQAKDNLIKLKEIINDFHNNLDKLDLEKIITEILNKIDYLAELKKDEDTYDDRYQNIKELQTVIVESKNQAASDNNEEILSELLTDIALRTDHDKNQTENAVILSTYHQVKGLEFKAVFLVAMENGVFPSYSTVTKSDIEEERRIFYVGITRAMEHLYITHAKERMIFGTTNLMASSEFLKDFDESLYTDVNQKSIAKALKKETGKAPKKKESSSQDLFKTGDKVIHKIWGEGLVCAITGDSMKVAFKMPIGVKTIIMDHPSVSKKK